MNAAHIAGQPALRSFTGDFRACFNTQPVRSRAHAARGATKMRPNQVFDRPCAPSTGIVAPVIQLARGDASITTA
jgi:hypothetical protein